MSDGNDNKYSNFKTWIKPIILVIMMPIILLILGKLIISRFTKCHHFIDSLSYQELKF